MGGHRTYLLQLQDDPIESLGSQNAGTKNVVAFFAIYMDCLQGVCVCVKRCIDVCRSVYTHIYL